MLKKIIIENFKGTENKTINFDRKTILAGGNESGKSTVENAYLWGHTGKDKQSRQNYKIRNIHKPELDPRITLVYPQISFRRTFTKTAKGGNTTVYEIDRGLGFEAVNMSDSVVKGVETKGYDTYVREMFPEFRLVSDLMYFPEKMNTTEARELVLKYGGRPTNEEIFEHLEGWEVEILRNVLETYDIGEAQRTLKKSLKIKENDKKTIKGKLKGKREDIERLTPRASKESLSEGLEKTLKNIRDIEEELKNIEVGADLRENIVRAKDEKSKAKQKVHERNQEAKRAYETKKESIRRQHQEIIIQEDSRFFEAKRRYDSKVSDIKSQLMKRAKINELEEKKIYFENKMKEVTSEEFKETPFESFVFAAKIYEQRETCELCGQRLPVEVLKEYKKNFDKAEEARKQEFYASEKRRRDVFDEQQETSRSTFEELIERSVKDINKRIDELDKEIDEISRTDFEALEKELVELEKPEKIEVMPPSYPQEPEEELFDASEFDENIRLAEVAFYEASGELEERRKPYINKLDTEIVIRDQIQNQLGEWESVGKLEKGYQETVLELRQTIEEAEEINKKLSAIKDYNRVLAEMVKTTTREVFGAEIELFRVQVDGELKPDFSINCETKEGLIPFSVANNASRINTARVIIGHLQKLLDSYPTVFVDNSEGVEKFDEVDIQEVRMYVLNEDIFGTVPKKAFMDMTSTEARTIFM